MTLPILLLIAAALADIYTSHRAFKRGRVEVNPLIAKLFGKRPSFAAMLAVKAVAVGVIVYVGTPTLILIAAAAWAAVAVYNATH